MRLENEAGGALRLAKPNEHQGRLFIVNSLTGS